MSDHEKKHAPPIPEDSPILVSGFVGHELKSPVVLVWDPFGENWRGLWRTATGRPTRAWLEDKATAPGQITRWHQLRLRSEWNQGEIEVPHLVEKGQPIGQPGMNGGRPAPDLGELYGGPAFREESQGGGLPPLFRRSGGLQRPAPVVSETRSSAPSARPADRDEELPNLVGEDSAVEPFTVQVRTEGGTITGYMHAEDGALWLSKWVHEDGTVITDERAKVAEFEGVES